MACYIFGAGSYYGLRSKPDVSDYVIAADGGWATSTRSARYPRLTTFSASRWKRTTPT